MAKLDVGEHALNKVIGKESRIMVRSDTDSTFAGQELTIGQQFTGTNKLDAHTKETITFTVQGFGHIGTNGRRLWIRVKCTDIETIAAAVDRFDSPTGDLSITIMTMTTTPAPVTPPVNYIIDPGGC